MSNELLGYLGVWVTLVGGISIGLIAAKISWNKSHRQSLAFVILSMIFAIVIYQYFKNSFNPILAENEKTTQLGIAFIFGLAPMISACLLACIFLLLKKVNQAVIFLAGMIWIFTLILLFELALPYVGLASASYF